MEGANEGKREEGRKTCFHGCCSQSRTFRAQEAPMTLGGSFVLVLDGVSFFTANEVPPTKNDPVLVLFQKLF